MGNILSFTLYHIRNQNNACPITADAEFNPLGKMVPTRFLHCKIYSFPFLYLISTLRGNSLKTMWLPCCLPNSDPIIWHPWRILAWINYYFDDCQSPETFNWALLVTVETKKVVRKWTFKAVTLPRHWLIRHVSSPPLCPFCLASCLAWREAQINICGGDNDKKDGTLLFLFN